MISYLSGHALAEDTILVGGVGYLVFTAAPLPVGQEVQVWVHTAVKENDISLFGFDSPAERALFVALTKVTGVAGKAALALLSLGAPVVAAAIATNDPAALCRAPGVGPTKAKQILASVKVAPAVLRELTDVTGGPTVANPGGAEPVDDLLATLTSLGHPADAARGALLVARGQTDSDAEPPVVLRAALKALASGVTRPAG